MSQKNESKSADFAGPDDLEGRMLELRIAAAYPHSLRGELPPG